MKKRLLAAAILVLPTLAWAEADPEAVPTPAAADVETPLETAQPTLDALLWVARPLVVFADTPNDPRFSQQMALIEENRAALEERLVVVLTDTDPAAQGPLRQALRPRGFGLVLIDTDGSIVQRRPAPTTVRELAGTIDRLPSRRQETGSRRQ